MLLNSPSYKVNLGVKQLSTNYSNHKAGFTIAESVLLYGIFFLLVTKKGEEYEGKLTCQKIS
ncbi:hypothetical protein SAMN05421821_10456 [Mucilaginibacter lappiensis]|uniref:Uncharacterized protein n=1 Tax=Mucilaginibacter lappiensis TaxID=354630 RepID=A0A1N6WNL1_9SPHI|nr:hypothetical protein [Mucilaginibacter lappiensis]MBB6127769.1 hypothetical protein [Mucilaginibacter lappiensis]SIQ91618.1 hypothetical protein SAMN05421821_10456 [Mucilaginibacter lappiensis]